MANVSPWTHRPTQDFQIFSPQIIDIDGATVDFPLFSIINLPPCWGNLQDDVVLIIKELIVIYTAATSASSANQVRLGSDVNPALYTSFTTPAGRAIGDVDIIDQDDFTVDPRVFTNGNILSVRGGGGTGTGAFLAGVTLSYDYTDYYAFNQFTGT